MPRRALPGNVNQSCIPLELAPVLQKNKVWGWELGVFEPIRLILDAILGQRATPTTCI